MNQDLSKLKKILTDRRVSVVAPVLLILYGLPYLLHGGIPSVSLVAFPILPFCEVRYWAIREEMRKERRKLRIKDLSVIPCVVAGLVIGNGFFCMFANQIGREGDSLLWKVEFPFIIPSRVVADSEGSVYVLDSHGRIQKYNANGRFQYGFPGSPFQNPVLLVIDENDNVYHHALDGIVKRDPEGNVESVFEMDTNVGPWDLRLTEEGTLIYDEDASEPQDVPVRRAVRAGEMLDGYYDNFHDQHEFITADGTSYKIEKSLSPHIRVRKGPWGEVSYIQPSLIVRFATIHSKGGFLLSLVMGVPCWLFHGLLRDDTSSKGDTGK